MLQRLKLNLGMLLFCSLVSAASFAHQLPAIQAIPGGVALVPLQTNSESAPNVNFSRHKVMVVGQPRHWSALIGIPLTLTAGEHAIVTKDDSGHTSKQYFKVIAFEYPHESITISDENYVTPDQATQTRIKQERSKLKSVLATWHDTANPDTDFQWPVSGRISSPFGLQRFFNQTLRSRHTGLDIAAATGTPVHAVASGRVIESGNYFYTGHTVLIDHGQGLISMYCHLNKSLVKVGEQVKPSDVIAEVGATGRVTGPHLHLTVLLNQSKVEPRLFLPTSMPTPEKQTS